MNQTADGLVEHPSTREQQEQPADLCGEYFGTLEAEAVSRGGRPGSQLQRRQSQGQVGYI